MTATSALLALYAAIAGCTDPSGEQSQDRPKIIDSLRIEVPFGDADAAFDNNPPLAINASGEFELKGKALSSEELSSFLSEQRNGDTPYLSVQIDEKARFGDAIALLSPLAEKTKVYVAPTIGGRFNRGQVKRNDPILKRRFVGEIGDYHFPLTASHLSQEDQCVLLLGGGGASILEGRPLSSAELFQVSTKFLNRYVEHHGGADAVANKPEVASTLVARIQAQADTPWRCVAGPIERLNEVGWPVLQYELVP